MMTKVFFMFWLLLLPFSGSEPKMYTKEYHDNGVLKAEGWLMGDQKTDYWKFYHPNGKLKSEGHYATNERTDYWHFYDTNGKLIKEGHYARGLAQDWWIFYDLAHAKKQKIEYSGDRKNGFCLIYNKNKLTKVEKYENDQRVGVWTSVSSFRRDNPEVSLFSL